MKVMVSWCTIVLQHPITSSGDLNNIFQCQTELKFKNKTFLHRTSKYLCLLVDDIYPNYIQGSYLIFISIQSAISLSIHFQFVEMCTNTNRRHYYIKHIHKIKSKIPFSKNFLVHSSLNKLKLTTKSPYITYTSRAQHSGK